MRRIHVEEGAYTLKVLLEQMERHGQNVYMRLDGHIQLGLGPAYSVPRITSKEFEEAIAHSVNMFFRNEKSSARCVRATILRSHGGSAPVGVADNTLLYIGRCPPEFETP